MSASLEVAHELVIYLQSSLCLDQTLTEQSDLIAAGAIDSLIIMELVRHIETTYGIRLGPAEINPRNFRTAETLGELVVSKMPEARMTQTACAVQGGGV